MQSISDNINLKKGNARNNINDDNTIIDDNKKQKQKHI